MPDAAPPGPGALLVERLQTSRYRLSDSVRASALWLAVLDGPLDPREFHEVGLALTHEPEGLPLHEVAEALAADPFSPALPRLFRFLRGQRSPKRTESLLDLYVRVVAADGRISEIERHALIFLIRPAGRPADPARRAFRGPARDRIPASGRSFRPRLVPRRRVAGAIPRGRSPGTGPRCGSGRP